MCPGNKGPSAAELIQQEEAATARAKVEVEKLNTEKELEKQAENARIVSEQAAAANADATRRINNRTLLAGLLNEEDEDSLGLEDPKSQSTAKRKRATLLSTAGE